MQEIWFNQAKSKEEREKVKQDFGVAYNAFRRLEKILKKKELSTDYDMSNWSLHTAHVNGYNQAIEHVLNLIKEGDE